MPDDERAWVYWYDHTCPWITKYCDEYHRVGASVPVAVLRQYLVLESVDARIEEETR